MTDDNDDHYHDQNQNDHKGDDHLVHTIYILTLADLRVTTDKSCSSALRKQSNCLM